MNRLRIKALREILFEQLALSLEKFGYKSDGKGLFERRLTEQFCHLIGAGTIVNPSGFYIMVGVRDEPISDAMTKLYREAEVLIAQRFGNDKPDLMTSGAPTICGNLYSLVEKDDWKEWRPE